MKNIVRLLRLCSMLLGAMLLVSTAAFAAKGVDFSGSWTLNTKKSEVGERGRGNQTITIQQESNKLTIERTFRGRNGQERSMSETYTLDGKKSTNPFRNSEKVSTATWSDDQETLVIESTMSFERNGQKRTFEYTEEMSLSDDGQTLTIKRITDRGTRKMVYDKK